MSFVDVPLGGNGSLDLAGVTGPVPGDASAAARARGLDRVLVGLRPEALRSRSEGIPARVEAVEVLGADAYVYCGATVAGAETRLATRVEAHAAPARGESVRLVAGGGAHLFDPVSGERLGSAQA